MLQIVVNAAVIFMGIYQQPGSIGIMALFELGAIPVYFGCIGWKSKPKAINKIMGKWFKHIKKLIVQKFIWSVFYNHLIQIKFNPK